MLDNADKRQPQVNPLFFKSRISKDSGCYFINNESIQLTYTTYFFSGKRQLFKLCGRQNVLY